MGPLVLRNRNAFDGDQRFRLIVVPLMPTTAFALPFCGGPPGWAGTIAKG